MINEGVTIRFNLSLIKARYILMVSNTQMLHVRNTLTVEITKWKWIQKEQHSVALMAVLQDQVYGEQTHSGQLQAIYSLAPVFLLWFLIG